MREDIDIFKVGDRVRLIERSEGNKGLHPAPGTEGTITQCDGDGFPYVEWDYNENGWPVTAVKQERLQRVVSVPKLEHKVLIMQDRDDPWAVVARDLSTGEVGRARCAPEDGAPYWLSDDAFDLYEKKYFTGKLVCVESDYGFWTVGKVYPVSNGRICDDDGDRRYNVTSAEEISKRLTMSHATVKFIALKE